jgi:5-formyltetrahydrofolate cyclo-ligase
VIREEIKSALRELTPQEHSQKSQKVANHLWSFLAGFYREHFNSPDSYLGLFAPLFDEVNIFGQEEHRNYPCAFPFGEEQHKFLMSFKESTYDDLVECRRFGVTIRSPKQDAPLVSPQVLVIPGIGFSHNGARLGRGKGYYDRYLEKFSGTKIGVCFEEQLIEKLPCDEHDQLMDFIVSENGVIDCNGKK